MALTALALNCTLKPKGESSTDAMIAVLADAFKAHGVTITETIRVAAHDVKPGVTSNESDGDAWPAIREKILAADILILGGPIWMGQTGSVAKRALERLDAFISETDDRGRMPSYSKVAVAAIVGNEDGAHFSSAQIFQSLNDVGFTIPSPRRLLLGRRGDGIGGLQGLGRNAGKGDTDREDGGVERGASGRVAEGRTLSGVSPAPPPPRRHPGVVPGSTAPLDRRRLGLR